MPTDRFKLALSKWIPELERKIDPKFTYHNVAHTFSVMEFCKVLAKDEGINPEETELLLFADLFHDYGFVKSPIEHEITGAQIASEYCKTVDFNTEQIKQIEELILSTKWPQNAKNHLSMILCDSDLAYLGTPDYPKIADNLREERKALGFEFSDEDWFNLQINFLKEQHFFTASAKKHFQSQKDIFLEELLSTKRD